eukprot:g561.t1
MPNGLSAALAALDRPISDKEILDLIKITGQLNVWTCTWNMHAKSWPENLRKELNVSSAKRVNHVYVMGTQECERSILSSAFLPSKWMWESALLKCFGERYVMVRSETMQALHVVVFVHRAVLRLETASKLSFPKKIEDDSKQEQEQHTVPSEADAERFVQSMTEKEQAKATTLHSSLSKVGTALDTCTTCVYVLERIKMGYQYMLPSICVELYSLSTDAATFQQCHEVLAGLSVWGNNIRSWFQEGCYKAEPYGAMEKITPCPSHVICSQMQSLTKKDFCVKPEADFKGEGGKF